MTDITHPSDICELADTVAELVTEKLSASVIPSSFPAEIGEWIREACAHGLRQWIYTIPMMGPSAMFAEFRFNPDGTFNLELRDTNGLPFWRGTFRPADEGQRL